MNGYIKVYVEIYGFLIWYEDRRQIQSTILTSQRESEDMNE